MRRNSREYRTAAQAQLVAIHDITVDVQILGLRKKLGIRGDYIETVRGVEYRMTEGLQRKLPTPSG